MPEANPRELIILVSLAVGVLWMGIYPKPFMDPLRAPVASLMARLDSAQAPQVAVQVPTGQVVKASTK